jgi:pyruvate dehydrogenase (quinone)
MGLDAGRLLSAQFVDLEQKVADFLPAAVDLKSPTSRKWRSRSEFYVVRVEDLADLKEGVSTVLSHNGPTSLDVVTDPLELSMPPKVQLDRAHGFGFG